MSTSTTNDEAIRILSLDNGGSGSYSQLVVIREYMGRLARTLGADECDVYPADYFDIMGGVGFGGLVAILLGHLRMNVDQASETLVKIANAVFPLGSDGSRTREVNTKKLREAVEGTIEGCGMPLDMKMNDERSSSVKCRVVLYAATTANLSHPTAFRTYASSGPSFNPTIVEAICATMAIPSFFSPVKIGPRMREQSFAGAPVGAHNPTRELLKEASKVFGEYRRISQILSIGAGRQRVLSLDLPADMNSVNRLLEDLAVDSEMVATELSTRLFNVDAYLRLNVDSGMESVGMDDWGGLGAIESHTNAYVEKPDVTEAIEASLRHLRERIGTITVGQINHSGEIKTTAKAVPTVTPYYVMRKNEWELILLHLVESKPVAQTIFPITGMGGCGKTQIVSYFVREKGSLFTHVVFVDASSQNSIKTDLQAWARSLRDSHEKALWEDAIRILANTPLNERWLLVLDNADDPRQDMTPFFPNCHHGTVVITSRNRDVGNLANTYHLELGEMTQEEALSTLVQAARRPVPLPAEEMESANKLMRELGCLAVALVHAGTYCQQLSSTVHGVLQPYTFTQYLALFSSQRAALMTRDGPATLDGYQRGVYATLNLSYQAMPSNSKVLFQVFSRFHYSDIPFSMLEAAAENSFEDYRDLIPRPEEHKQVIASLYDLLCPGGLWSELKVQEIIQSLRSFSLVSTTIVSGSLFLQIHPLVQSWARDVLLENSDHYRSMARTIVTSCCRPTNIGLYRYLLPHIDDMLSRDNGQEWHIRDQMAVGDVLNEQGQYRAAEALFSAALRALRRVCGDDALSTLEGMSRLADTHRRQGRFEEAAKLELEVLEKQNRILGGEHPSTITTAANLATIYHDQGRFDKAEKLQLEVLEKQHRILGGEHLFTIATVANLAMTYYNQGRYDESEKLQSEVLEKQHRILGAEHPFTIATAANLAMIHHSQGQFDKAEKLQLEVLKNRSGTEHPSITAIAGSLGFTYYRQGRLEEAQKLQLEVLEKQHRILGTEHPFTITTGANLAMTYHGLGRFDEAEKLQLDVLEKQRRTLGTEHPFGFITGRNLAMTYYSQGRFDEAEKMQLEVLEKQRRILGGDHPSTIVTAANLAMIYHGQGRFDEAENLQLDGLERLHRVVGAKHLFTITTTGCLARTYHDQGRFDKAETLQLDALEKLSRIFGMDHADTTTAARNLALTYHSQGRFDEAEKLQLGELEKQRRILGEEHPEAILAAVNLGNTYMSQKRWKEAEKLLVPAVDLGVKVLGPQHLHTRIYVNDLAWVYLRRWKFAKARKTMKLLK